MDFKALYITLKRLNKDVDFSIFSSSYSNNFIFISTVKPHLLSLPTGYRYYSTLPEKRHNPPYRYCYMIMELEQSKKAELEQASA